MTVEGKNLVESFIKAFLGAIEGRYFPAHPIVVRLDSELLVHRQHRKRHETAPPGGRLTLAQLDVESCWEEVTDLGGLIRVGLEAMPAVKQVTMSGEMTLPLNAVLACRFARRLMAQMGVSTADFDDDALAAGSTRRPGEDAFNFNRRLPALVAKELVEQLRRRIPPGAAMLCLQSRDALDLAEWRGASGELIRGERIKSLLRYIMTPAVADMQNRINEIKTIREQHIDAALQTVKKIHPAVFDAVEMARKKKRSVLLRLCTAHVREGRVPMDVWLVIGGGRTGRCGHGVTLEARRAHHEFVLESISGDRFYFPPIQLVARLIFNSLGVRAAAPRVRQPAGGFEWIHPYSGRLERDPYEQAIYYADDDDQAMHEPSSEALATWPHLAARTDVAMENNLCLANQGGDIQLAQNELQAKPMHEGEPDVLAAVTGLHDIARHGLTRGHQRNQSPPRAELAAPTMMYPLPRKKLAGPLARREYKYHEGEARRPARQRAADLLAAMRRGEVPF